MAKYFDFNLHRWVALSMGKRPAVLINISIRNANSTISVFIFPVNVVLFLWFRWCYVSPRWDALHGEHGRTGARHNVSPPAQTNWGAHTRPLLFSIVNSILIELHVNINVYDRRWDLPVYACPGSGYVWVCPRVMQVPLALYSIEKQSSEIVIDCEYVSRAQRKIGPAESVFIFTCRLIRHWDQWDGNRMMHQSANSIDIECSKQNRNGF